MSSNTIIQYPSSSFHAMQKYDLFVSFRGEDTRNNFTGFLFQALCRKGIEAFKDDMDLKKGESIAPELLQAIQGSRLFIVVFSKNYASSTWCLRELVEIFNCIETSSQRRVLPIFYDVDPSDVRKQSGYYEKAFEVHAERFKKDKQKTEEVQKWRETLQQVANLSGWHIRNKPQYAEIDQIVQTITNILGPKFSSLPNDDLVGMESRVEELAELLLLGSVNDVRVVGINGMSGIGKSTVVRALYERISHQYDFTCFIDDVSKTYRDSSMLGVQKQLLCQSLNEKDLDICNVSEGTCLVWTRLCNARALIVLDNVDEVRQLKMLTGSRETMLRKCLAGGSRIIIISRDGHILRTHGVDDVYHVQPLNPKEAVQLFCRNAFKCDNIMSDFEKLTHGVLSHADGHPLAIEVLGSSLFGRSVSQWRSALDRLRESKSKNVMDVLRISCDELDDPDKEIFLEIACFFNNYEEQYAKEILDFRGFQAEYGLQVLIDKSLITVKDGLIHMHSLLIDLGRCIVREKSPKEPRKWSRLWDYQDFHKVMSDNMVAENLEAIVVRQCKWEFHETTIRANALSQMRKLKLLTLDNVNFSGCLDHVSHELGYIIWNKYPFKCLPSSFQPDKLVVLVLSESSIKKLWEDTKPLHNLRRLDLSYSGNLIKIPDFAQAPNLEWLNLQGCIKVKKIDPSVGLLRKLTFLSLKGCISLIKLPHFEEDLNLEILNLKECIKLKKIDPSIGLLRKLTFLDLSFCTSLIKLPHFGKDLNLETLNLGECIQIRQIDPSIGFLKKLKYLTLANCKNLVSLPNSILSLNSLEYLSLYGCSKLQLLNEPKDSEHLKKLCIGEAPICSYTTPSLMERWFRSPLHLSRAHEYPVSRLLPSLFSFPFMHELDLSFCNLHQIPDAIGNLHCLETLNLSGNNFATLPNLKELSKLYHLDLQHCKKLKYLSALPFPSQSALPTKTDLSPWFLLALHELTRWKVPWLIREPKTGIRPARLYIFNCPELIELKWCSSMSLSWMIQIVQANLQYIRFQSHIWPPCIESIIPGSEIPRWFNNQHAGMGSSISIDASPLMQHHKDCIGVACCVVVAARPGRGRGLRSGPAVNWGYFSTYFPVDLGAVMVDKSDHMWLFFCSSQQCTVNRGTYSEMEIDIISWETYHVEVKKYGYRWVYEQDLELSNLTVMHSGNSASQKCHLLEIE